MLVLKGAFESDIATLGRTQSEISQSDVINYLKNFIKPTTHKEWKYSKDGAIKEGVRRALREKFGSVPTSPKAVNKATKDWLVDKSLAYARDYYMQYTEVPDWSW